MEKVLAKLVLVVGVLMHCGSTQVRSDAKHHRYKAGDYVPLYVNKVGPFLNPSETYPHFDLPFCQPDHIEERKQTLGEMLSGDHLINAPYKLEFLVEKFAEVACRKNLTKEEVSQFRTAIKREYYFQMYYDDDLPVREFVGEIHKQGILDNYKYFLYKHIRFDILFNKDRVIEINVEAYPRALYPGATVDLTEDKETYVEFVYTVFWKEVDIPFEKRMEKYSSVALHSVEPRWFIVLNSCFTLLLLAGFLVRYYMRVLKKDLTELQDEGLVSSQEERGWKSIRDDVFTCPVHKSLLSAALGSGTQLLALTILVLLLGIFDIFHPHKPGCFLTALIVIYAITSCIAGYTATSFNCQLEGTNWLGNLLLTGCLFGGPLLFTFLLLNSIATAYKASIAVSLSTIVALVLIWIDTFPYVVLGGIFGKSSYKDEPQDVCQNIEAELQAPLCITKVPREIPPLRWYKRALPQMALAGIIPFSVIRFELDLVILSVWDLRDKDHRNYVVYTILFTTFILLLIAVCLVNVLCTWCQLVAEDYKWWWRSFLCGGSIGLYVYGYCIYYYFAKSEWSGSLQISFFFGYMACISYGFFLVFGTVGFTASFCFVRYIYSSVKCD
ncbi:transmembrane 9 superfamily member 2 [Morus notabilis]|uniref:transmembrane 9 superfamily member 2 n=1 Tax=Morus notabilis TaxID=981085 RepID=UPI000CED4EB0|nr:transmembrane 9 superfamily member 2 [Morus notabilis]